MTNGSEPGDTLQTGARVHGPEVDNPRTALLSRPALAAVTLVLLAAATELVPGLSRFSLFTRHGSARAAPVATATQLEVGEAKLETETRSGIELPSGEANRSSDGRRGPIAQAPQAADSPPIDEKPPPVFLEDASGTALKGFYQALLETRRKQPGALTRISHFGDSIVVSDYVSST
ncbi:MAG TPA: hypothetical protein VK524_02495, partial [Polyangiaceae bacterium]|nr:hypothetical protein [Polyangiaceae bacterium]